MDVELLKKVLREVKHKLSLDYAFSKGFMSPSCTTKMLDETYGENAIGIYARWFGENQEQPPLKQLDKVYINHNLGEEREFIGRKLVEILREYYSVEWDCSNEKTILIKEECVYYK